MRNRRIILTLLLLFLLVSITNSLTPTWAAESQVLSKISYYKADLVAVLQQLAAECGYNLIVSPEVTGTVSIEMTQVTFEEALPLIIEGQNLVYHQEGRTIRVAKPGSLPTEKKTVGSFKVIYADPIQVVETIQKITGVQEISADKRIRVIMAYGDPETIDRIGQIIEVLDQRMKQVTMEVKVVEVSSSALRKLGAEWSIDNSSFDWGVARSGAELIIQMISSGHSWNVIFSNLATKGQARLVSSPSVAAVDGEKASILIGEKVPFETKDKDGNITITFIDVGVKLIFTPKIQQGDELVFDLITQVNSIGEKTGNSYIIGAREVSSKIQARIGETVFLGGLITQQERETLMKVPVLGDIFLLGKLFRRSDTTKEDTELIITITPKWNVPVILDQESK